MSPMWVHWEVKLGPEFMLVSKLRWQRPGDWGDLESGDQLLFLLVLDTLLD